MVVEHTEDTRIVKDDMARSTVNRLHDTSSGIMVLTSHSLRSSRTRSSCDSIQTTSTATYELQQQEADNAFNRRIEKLCQDLWPPPTSTITRLRRKSFFRSFVSAPQLPLIKHLDGGGFNHITSVTLPMSYKVAHRDLILRIPREDNSRPDLQVGILHYVRKRTLIPVPTIETTDFTCNNAVGRPFVLQHRIPGTDLQSVWNDLSHSQRRVIAKEMGHLIETLLSVESGVAGIIEPATDESYTSTKLPNVVPFTLMDMHRMPVEELESGNLKDLGTSRARETTLNFFEVYITRWRQSALEKNLGKMNCDVELYDDMLKAAREMDALGLFKPDLHCLCHLDLYPRNIMVETGPGDSIRVTGILDWDDAVVAPKVVNCQPPGWLWGYNVNSHTENGILPWPYESEGANKLPSTPEQQELKAIFDKHAGPEYPRLAYDESSRLIRGLFRIATLGLKASWYNTAAERIVNEWNVLRQTLV